MARTVFDTPVIRSILRGCAQAVLHLTGWRSYGAPPRIPQYVLLAAPHTSNWDLPFMLFICLEMRVKLYWMGKKGIFRRPFGGLFRWLGGIAIDRSKSHNVVQQTIERFHRGQPLVLVVAPSGTRSRVSTWKTGFYHIARGAGVPLVCGFLDYRRKIGGIGPVIQPSGDIQSDMAKLRSFYAGIRGKRPLEKSEP